MSSNTEQTTSTESTSTAPGAEAVAKSTTSNAISVLERKLESMKLSGMFDPTDQPSSTATLIFINIEYCCSCCYCCLSNARCSSREAHIDCAHYPSQLIIYIMYIDDDLLKPVLQLRNLDAVIGSYIRKMPYELLLYICEFIEIVFNEVL